MRKTTRRLCSSPGPQAGCSRLDLTIDTCVLVHAGSPRASLHQASRSLLQGFRDDLRAPKLNLDKRGRIEAEYDHQLAQKSVGKLWLKQLALSGRLNYIETKALPRRVRVRLEQAGYHRADHKFVETAHGSESRRLVTHDQAGFSPSVCVVLRRHLGVIVTDATDACEWAGYPLG